MGMTARPIACVIVCAIARVVAGLLWRPRSSACAPIAIVAPTASAVNAPQAPWASSDHPPPAPRLVSTHHDACAPANIATAAIHARGVSGVQFVDDTVLQAMEDYNDVAPAHNPPYVRAMRLLGMELGGKR